MMDFTLTLQSSAETTEKVTEQNTAIRYASGTAPVYATPALVGLMEHAAVLAGDSCDERGRHAPNPTGSRAPG